MVSLRKCTKSKTKQVGSIRAYQHNEALQEIQGFFNSLGPQFQHRKPNSTGLGLRDLVAI